MNDHQRERLKEVLFILESLPAEERRGWLDRKLADDPVVLAEAVSLLESSGGGDERMFRPVVRAPEGLADGFAEGLSEGLAEGGMPRRIGPFTIEGLLGQGGMANVYRGYQDQPVRRAVAVKVIKPGFGGPEQLARFRGEAAVISRLDHPNIARLISVGADSAGQPFIAMDLVDGPPITDYACIHQLGLAERLRLFVQACRGVQHAHNRGILHRDLKPSNILVDQAAGEPVVRVIDFGVARLLDAETETRHTAHGRVVGTLAYMSPEQADPLTPDPDVRSDVYSLGVVLHELLGGRPAESEVETAGKTAQQVQRELMEKRSAAPARIGAGESADVACVAMKAMEADPQARYASAGELADDVERFLRGDAIRARPPTRWQRAHRFARRNRVLTAAAGAVTLGVVVGMGGLGYGYWRSVAERERAERAAVVFEEVALTLRRLVLAPRAGVNAPYTEVLKRGAADFLESPPESAPVRGRVAFSLAQAMHQAGERGLTKQLAEMVVRDVEGSEFDRENAPLRDSMLFTAYTMLATIERSSGTDERAAEMWERALALGGTLTGVGPSELLAASASFADVLAARGELERAEAELLRARESAERQGAPPTFLALLDGAMAGVLSRMQRHDEAIALGGSALDLRSPARDNSQAFTIMLGLKHVKALLDAGRDADAADVGAAVLALAEATHGAGHANRRSAELHLILARARLGLATAEEVARAGALADEAAASEMGGRAWRAQAVLVQTLVAAGRAEDAVARAKGIESELIGAMGAGSRDVALLRWELGRALVGVRPEEGAAFLRGARETYARDLGEGAMVCRLIERELAGVEEE